MSVAVLITCHNRRDTTLRCLDRLFAPDNRIARGFTVWLVDDGSTDGTAEAVARAHPAVRIVRGPGDLFWCGGMRLAWERAATGDPEVYLWLNDDVALLPAALPRLAATAAAHPGAVVVGSCRCARTGRLSYGGRRRAGRHPGKTAPVPPQAVAVPCDTFEGNIVWIPREVRRRIGLLGPFRHAMGDIDYGYRAADAGVELWVAPGDFGECSRNPSAGSWEDRSLAPAQRWRKVRGIKGLPGADWWRFCRRHGGTLAPMFFVSPYCRVLLGR